MPPGLYALKRSLTFRFYHTYVLKTAVLMYVCSYVLKNSCPYVRLFVCPKNNCPYVRLFVCPKKQLSLCTSVRMS